MCASDFDTGGMKFQESTKNLKKKKTTHRIARVRFFVYLFFCLFFCFMNSVCTNFIVNISFTLPLLLSHSEIAFTRHLKAFYFKYFE